MPYADYSPGLIASLGAAIYQQVREQVEPDNKGKFFVVDIESGDYEIDEEDLHATRRLLAKRPNAIVYGLRIGYPAAYRLGGQVAMDRS